MFLTYMNKIQTCIILCVVRTTHAYYIIKKKKKFKQMKENNIYILCFLKMKKKYNHFVYERNI